ncbi:MAG: ATP-binding protein [Dehalococcoidales bacterium]|nr:ATP-binding protein [Dehalococcoidales bacterium]
MPNIDNRRICGYNIAVWHFIVISDQQSLSVRQVKNRMGREKSQKTKMAEEETSVNDNLSARQEITASMQSTLELKRVLQQISDGVLHWLGFSHSFILVLDDEGRFFKGTVLSAKDGLVLVKQAEQALESEMHLEISEPRVPVRKGYSRAWDTILSNKVYITHNLHELVPPRFSQSLCSKIQKILGVETIVAVPLSSKQGVIGTLLVGTKQDGITQAEIDSLMAFANQAGIAIENARLYRKLELAYQELETRQQDLIEEKRQISSLLLAISHEFKVPLTSIKTMGSLLAEELRGDAQSPQVKMVDNIRRNVDKIEKRLAELMDFARMQASTIELQLQPTNVKSIIEEVVSLCLPFALSKKQTLTVEVPDSLPQVMLDQLRFERIITNLLINASKFTLEGGMIELKARVEGDSLVVEVRDSGMGISDSEQRRVFEPFYRGKTSELSSTGLGLGLAIVKQLVELHQGKVWVKSKPKKGSTFTISLPLGMVEAQT